MENRHQNETNQEAKKVIWVAVKELARERIGQPPPTKVRGRKGGRRSDGRHRAGVTGALDIYDRSQEDLDYIPDTPRMATNPALHGNRVTGIPSRYLYDARQKRHDTETLFHFSPEAIAHANYLQRTQGDAAMNQYLKEIKERKVDHLDLAKAQVAADDKKKQNIGGTVEQQLEDAETKARHYREEAERMEKKADEQDKIALKFREILDIMGGNSGRRAAPGERVPHGEWRKRMEALARQPISRRDLRNAIVKQYNVLPGAAYGAMSRAIEKEILREVEDGLLQYAGGGEGREEE